jgi:hypothetical protein
VNLAWADNSTAEAAYVVERATNASFSAGLQTFALPAGSTSLVDTTVAAKTTNYYRVTALLNGLVAGPSLAATTATPAASAPTLNSVTFNDGSAQRSMITSITLAFSGPVTLGPGAVVISGVSGNPASVEYVQTANSDGSSYVLTFPSLSASSLADGQYQLKVNAAQVASADGAATMETDSTTAFYRLFGDGDGNGTVDFNDFLSLQNAFGSTTGSVTWNAAFDSDSNNLIDFNDFLSLQNRFGMSLS